MSLPFCLHPSMSAMWVQWIVRVKGDTVPVSAAAFSMTTEGAVPPPSILEGATSLCPLCLSADKARRGRSQLGTSGGHIQGGCPCSPMRYCPCLPLPLPVPVLRAQLSALPRDGVQKRHHCKMPLPSFPTLSSPPFAPSSLLPSLSLFLSLSLSCAFFR